MGCAASSVEHSRNTFAEIQKKFNDQQKSKKSKTHAAEEKLELLLDEWKTVKAVSLGAVASNYTANNTTLFNQSAFEVFDHLSPLHLPYSRLRRSAFSLHYELQNIKIGSGASGPVRLAVHKETKLVYAVKSLHRKNASLEADIYLCRETLIHLSLNHPNIVKLCEVFIEDTAVHMVMEYCKGRDFRYHLDKSGCYAEEECRQIVHQMLLAIRYCHQRNVCHRDMKLENWVHSDIGRTSPIKMIDFGVSTIFTPGSRLAAMSGTVEYINPEMIDGSYNEACDIWSIGVTIYWLLSNESPFRGRTHAETFSNIRNKRLNLEGGKWKLISQEAKAFLKDLLQKDATKRLSATDALLHPWLHKIQKSIDFEVDRSVLQNILNFSTYSIVKKVTFGIVALFTMSNTEEYLANEFFKMDSEGLGRIDINELANLFYAKMNVTEEEALNVFQNMDLLGDSFINYWEFLAANIQRADDVLVRMAFNKFDTDKKGHINVENLRNILGNSYAGLLVEEIFRRSDYKRNGVIDFDEYLLAFDSVSGVPITSVYENVK